jgi:hypothetical protein
MRGTGKALRYMLSQLCPHQIYGFSWTHRYPIDTRILLEFIRFNSKSLTTLQVFDTIHLQPDHNLIFLSSLNHIQIRHLDWRSITQDDLRELHHPVRAFRSTLQTLVVGTERRLYHCYKSKNGERWEDEAVSLQQLLSNAPQGSTAQPTSILYPKIKKLTVIGMLVDSVIFDPADLPRAFDAPIPLRLTPYIDFTKLLSLRLESCPDAEVLLNRFAVLYRYLAVVNANAFPPQQYLREFALRNEETDGNFTQPSFIQALESFLASFSGLKSLSVLLDNSKILPDPNCFIANHGATLEVLVWGGREKPRSTLRKSDKSLYLGKTDDPNSPIRRILAGCSNLQELSIPWWWGMQLGDIFNSIDRNFQFDLLNLRTVHFQCSPAGNNNIGSFHNSLSLGWNTSPTVAECTALIRYTVTELLSPAVQEPSNLLPRPRRTIPLPHKLSLVAIGPNNFVDRHGYKHIRCPENLSEWHSHEGDTGHEVWECDRLWAQCLFFKVSYLEDLIGGEMLMLREVGGRCAGRVGEWFEGEEVGLRCFDSYYLK